MELGTIVAGKQQTGDVDSEVNYFSKLDCERCSLQRASLTVESPVNISDIVAVENGLVSMKETDEDKDSDDDDEESTPLWLRRSLGSLLGLLAGLFLTVGSLLSGSVKSMGVMQTCSARSFFAALFLGPPLLIFKPSFK